MTQATQIVLPFARLSGKHLQADFDGGSLSSDGGVLFLREIEAHVGVIRRFVEVLQDPRDPRYIATKAENYLTSTGIGDTAYIGPEAEFFIIDGVRSDHNRAVSLVAASRRELPWKEAGAYAIAQIALGIIGAWAAHLMFDMPTLLGIDSDVSGQRNTHAQSGALDSASQVLARVAERASAPMTRVG